MKFSVIIPTYNAPRFFYECLKSLIHQTLSNELYEIIVVLNGDCQRHYHKIEEFVDESPVDNIRIFCSEPAGVSGARNLGLDKAQGDYIVFSDDDDYMSERFLEELLGLSHESHIVVSDVICFDEAGRESKDYLGRHFAETQNELSLYQNRKYFSVIWGKSIPRSMLTNVRFDPQLPPIEDVLFMVEMSSGIERIVKTRGGATYHRRIRSNSASRKKYPLLKILATRFRLIFKLFILVFKGRYNVAFVFSRILGMLRHVYWDVLGKFESLRR